MNKAWKQIDLDGGGLQSVNLTLSRVMRKRSVAYAWWLLFPIGAHRIYLLDRLGALALSALSAFALAVLVVFGIPAAAIVAGIIVIWALVDLIWIDRRVTAQNKALRMQLYLREDTSPPSDYRGRFDPDDAEASLAEYTRMKELERGGHRPFGKEPTEPVSHVPSLHQQEALLRELSRRRRKPIEPED